MGNFAALGLLALHCFLYRNEAQPRCFSRRTCHFHRLQRFRRTPHEKWLWAVLIRDLGIVIFELLVSRLARGLRPSLDFNFAGLGLLALHCFLYRVEAQPRCFSRRTCHFHRLQRFCRTPHEKWLWAVLIRDLGIVIFELLVSRLARGLRPSLDFNFAALGLLALHCFLYRVEAQPGQMSPAVLRGAHATSREVAWGGFDVSAGNRDLLVLGFSAGPRAGWAAITSHNFSVLSLAEPIGSAWISVTPARRRVRTNLVCRIGVVPCCALAYRFRMDLGEFQVDKK